MRFLRISRISSKDGIVIEKEGLHREDPRTSRFPRRNEKCLEVVARPWCDPLLDAPLVTSRNNATMEETIKHAVEYLTKDGLLPSVLKSIVLNNRLNRICRELDALGFYKTFLRDGPDCCSEGDRLECLSKDRIVQGNRQVSKKNPQHVRVRKTSAIYDSFSNERIDRAEPTELCRCYRRLSSQDTSATNEKFLSGLKEEPNTSDATKRELQPRRVEHDFRDFALYKIDGRMKVSKRRRGKKKRLAKLKLIVRHAFLGGSACSSKQTTVSRLSLPCKPNDLILEIFKADSSLVESCVLVMRRKFEVAVGNASSRLNDAIARSKEKLESERCLLLEIRASYINVKLISLKPKTCRRFLARIPICQSVKRAAVVCPMRKGTEGSTKSMEVCSDARRLDESRATFFFSPCSDIDLKEAQLDNAPQEVKTKETEFVLSSFYEGNDCRWLDEREFVISKSVFEKNASSRDLKKIGSNLNPNAEIVARTLRKGLISSSSSCLSTVSRSSFGIQESCRSESEDHPQIRLICSNNCIVPRDESKDMVLMDRCDIECSCDLDHVLNDKDVSLTRKTVEERSRQSADVNQAILKSNETIPEDRCNVVCLCDVDDVFNKQDKSIVRETVENRSGQADDANRTIQKSSEMVLEDRCDIECSCDFYHVLNDEDVTLMRKIVERRSEQLDDANRPILKSNKTILEDRCNTKCFCDVDDVLNDKDVSLMREIVEERSEQSADANRTIQKLNETTPGDRCDLECFRDVDAVINDEDVSLMREIVEKRSEQSADANRPILKSNETILEDRCNRKYVCNVDDVLNDEDVSLMREIVEKRSEQPADANRTIQKSRETTPGDRCYLECSRCLNDVLNDQDVSLTRNAVEKTSVAKVARDRGAEEPQSAAVNREILNPVSREKSHSIAQSVCHNSASICEETPGLEISCELEAPFHSIDGYTKIVEKSIFTKGNDRISDRSKISRKSMFVERKKLVSSASSEKSNQVGSVETEEASICRSFDASSVKRNEKVFRNLPSIRGNNFTSVSVQTFKLEGGCVDATILDKKSFKAVDDPKITPRNGSRLVGDERIGQSRRKKGWNRENLLPIRDNNSISISLERAVRSSTSGSFLGRSLLWSDRSKNRRGTHHEVERKSGRKGERKETRKKFPMPRRTGGRCVCVSSKSRSFSMESRNGFIRNSLGPSRLEEGYRETRCRRVFVVSKKTSLQGKKGEKKLGRRSKSLSRGSHHASGDLCPRCVREKVQHGSDDLPEGSSRLSSSIDRLKRLVCAKLRGILPKSRKERFSNLCKNEKFSNLSKNGRSAFRVACPKRSVHPEESFHNFCKVKRFDSKITRGDGEEKLAGRGSRNRDGQSLDKTEYVPGNRWKNENHPVELCKYCCHLKKRTMPRRSLTNEAILEHDRVSNEKRFSNRVDQEGRANVRSRNRDGRLLDNSDHQRSKNHRSTETFEANEMFSKKPCECDCCIWEKRIARRSSMRGSSRMNETIAGHNLFSKEERFFQYDDGDDDDEKKRANSRSRNDSGRLLGGSDQRGSKNHRSTESCECQCCLRESRLAIYHLSTRGMSIGSRKSDEFSKKERLFKRTNEEARLNLDIVLETPTRRKEHRTIPACQNEPEGRPRDVERSKISRSPGTWSNEDLPLASDESSRGRELAEDFRSKLTRYVALCKIIKRSLAKSLQIDDVYEVSTDSLPR